MVKIILLIFSFISTVTVNILADTLPINNQTSEAISNRIPALFTPANYAFSILILIYILLAFWLWNVIREYRITSSIPWNRVLLFVASCIFNIAWIFFWHYELFSYSLITIIALLWTFFILYMTYSTEQENWKSRVPISIYLGWTFVATITNLDFVLTYYEFGGFGMTTSLWVVIFLTIATAIALHFRYHYNDRAIALVFIWAFIGIAARHKFDDLLITSASIFLSSVLLVGILFIKKTPSKR
ncbi:tryptophan-rich sensory protein [Psychrobacillus sp. FSL H8-0484]|uniref:tryptophan-rich sensory protein n=1 Tax=Psychrobacillus sp. FSL H8-0484 TaxID=2921390 RepID=UPI0030F6D4CD